jgi:IS30 family transposase
MGKIQQLSYHERRQIYSSLCRQEPKSSIAKTLGRSVSTVTREIKRNSDRFGYLHPEDAHKAAQKRKHINKPKIDRKVELQSFIQKKLRLRWSPDMIAGRWNLENPKEPICKETIYRWLYSSNDKKKTELRKLLVRAHKKRGFRSKPTKSTIKDRTSIGQRPDSINKRLEADHYECDLVFNRGSGSKNVCTLIERVARKCIIIRNDNKSTKTVIGAIIEHITKEKLIVKSITFDNGSEFADHIGLKQMGIDTYFCDPAKPYQKGSIEHLNGMLRRHLPFELEAASITKEYVEQINIMMNNMPRKILGYKTPLEMRKFLIQNSESRVKLARPATEAVSFNEKTLSVAFHC